MYTIGFTGGVGQEIRVRSIKLTRKAFISRWRHELFEWENGTRRLFRFSSFNAADLIGRAMPDRKDTWTRTNKKIR
jgi:hypothetical protein